MRFERDRRESSPDDTIDELEAEERERYRREDGRMRDAESDVPDDR